PREELPQCRKRAPAQLLRIGNLEHAPPGASDGLDAAQDRKEACQREDVARKDLVDLGCRKLLEKLAEGVDQAVERLVGNGLALVAAPRQRHRSRTPRGLQESSG